MKHLAVFLPAPIAAALLLLAQGCSDKAATPPADKPGQPSPAGQQAPAPEEISPLDALFQHADELYMGGETNEALASLENALGDETFKDARQQIFNTLVRMLLFSGKVPEARERMLAAYAKDEALASSSMGLLFSYYSEQGDITNAIAWTDEVLAVPTLAAPIRRQMREWNLLSLLQNGDDDRVVERCGALVGSASGDEAAQTLRRVLDALFDQRKIDLASRVIAESGKSFSTDVALRDLLLSSRLRLLAEQGKWQNLQSAFPAGAKQLSDADLQRLLRRVLGPAARAGQSAVSDALCLFVITNQSDKAQSFATASRQWVDNAARGAPAEVPARLNRLLGAKLRVDVLASLFSTHFYDLVSDPAAVAEMKDLGERLAPMASDESTRGSLLTMVLDSCFLLEDFDSALRLLKTGIPGFDKTWHDMAIAKVEAHKALKENRPKDAIAHFRSFMTIIGASKENEESDPSTGIVHTREMILGRNAKRIGDIYAHQVKDPAAAKAAYAEARALYQSALEKKPDAETLDVIRKEMAEIPAE